ncbi:hypothetical protein SAMD00079811_32740 [Scytonema sp. HK-05]|nr:hypothetical protein [Scytonema sp. HK-05]BAY45667.1 hypothetical protein SAMD00079811_32740 [Scytonema sp. HK-05]
MGFYPLGFYGASKGDRSYFTALITRYQRFGFPYQFAKGRIRVGFV